MPKHDLHIDPCFETLDIDQLRSYNYLSGSSDKRTVSHADALCVLHACSLYIYAAQELMRRHLATKAYACMIATRMCNVHLVAGQLPSPSFTPGVNTMHAGLHLGTPRLHAHSMPVRLRRPYSCTIVAGQVQRWQPASVGRRGML